jgi:hypothetical protein
MGLCVLLSGGILHLTTQGGGTERSAGGQLLPVWLSLLVFQSLRALGFAWRFWKDPKYVYGKGGKQSQNNEWAENGTPTISTFVSLAPSLPPSRCPLSAIPIDVVVVRSRPSLFQRVREIIQFVQRDDGMVKR